MALLEPGFLADRQSVATLVSQLHVYFKNTYSHYKIQQSNLVSQLEAADASGEQKIKQDIQEIQEELVIFGVLADALSIADRMLHAKEVRQELGEDSEVYKVHTTPDTGKPTL